MDPMDDRKSARSTENEGSIGEDTSPARPEREPGRGTDVEREGLTSRPSQRYPGDGEVPTSDSPRPSPDESEVAEDVEK